MSSAPELAVGMMIRPRQTIRKPLIKFGRRRLAHYMIRTPFSLAMLEEDRMYQVNWRMAREGLDA